MLNILRHESRLYKKLTPLQPKILRQWVCGSFFLICCSTFAYLFNVRFRLILRFLKISPSSESPFHIGSPPLSGSNFKHEHLTNDPYWWDMLAWKLRSEDFWYKDQTVLIEVGHQDKPSTQIPLVGKIKGRNIGEIS